MNLESFHRTLVRILIVIWISGIAIVAVDLFVLDKERKAWNELKPLTSFAFQEDNSEIEDLRAQHNKYMTEGILPDRPDGKDSMPLPPALDSTETASTDILEDASGLTIEDILSEARQTELASQIEPAAGDISAVFLKDEFQDKDNQIAGSDKAHDVLSVIQDLEPYADTDTLEADDFFNTPSAKEIENAHNKQVPENEPEPASNDQKASDVIASIGETKEDVNPPTTKTNTTPQYTSPKGRGQVVIIIDDMIDTAGTLCNAAETSIIEGAKSVTAIATHPVLSGEAISRLKDAPISKVIVCDTIKLDKEKRFDKLEIISVADVFGESMKRIVEGTSLSSMFNGF